MMAWRRGILVLPLAVHLAMTAAWSGPAGDGVLDGQVINKTGPVTSVAGIEVALTPFAGGVEEAKLTTTTDGAGQFAFRGLARGPARAYTVTVKYKGGEYTVERVVFTASETTKTVPITVYEPTTNEAVLRVSVHHMIVSPGPGALQITEVLAVANPTDRTFIGSKPAPGDRRETLRFLLPAGASELQYGDGLMECCVVAGKDGFIDTMDVKPGVREIAFTYTLPVQGNVTRMQRLLSYPTDVVEVLVADTGAQVTGVGLTAREAVEAQGNRYLRLSGSALRPGAAITLDLTGLASASRPTRWFAAVAALVVMTLGFVVSQRRSGPVTLRPTPLSEAETRQTLIEDLANLDEQFAAGQIPEAEYALERARMKRALAGLLQAASRSSSTGG